MCHYQEAMAERSERATIRIGPQGRIVIPATLRLTLGLSPGDVLVAVAEDNRLVLERPEAALQRLRGRFRHLPRDVSLADELIADRREDALQEGSP
jgi:AbrB family looped-hinge helix DNA binding protein